MWMFMHSVETILQRLNSDPAVCGMTFFHDARQQQFPLSHIITGVSIWYSTVDGVAILWCSSILNVASTWFKTYNGFIKMLISQGTVCDVYYTLRELYVCAYTAFHRVVYLCVCAHVPNTFRIYFLKKREKEKNLRLQNEMLLSTKQESRMKTFMHKILV